MDGKLNQSSFTVKIQPSKDCLTVIIEVWNYFLIIQKASIFTAKILKHLLNIQPIIVIRNM